MEVDKILYTQISEILDRVQKSRATHQKCLTELQILYKNNEFEKFKLCMEKVYHVVLQIVIKPQNPAYEKLFEFICNFITSVIFPNENDSALNVEEHPLLKYTLQFLLQTQKNVDVTIRFRSCQMLDKILNNMSEFDLNEELWENLLESMLERLNDLKTIIREETVKIVKHLQDPSDADDQIIKTFINLMNTDPQAKIRALCIENVNPRKDVIPHIVTKTRDINSSVRLAAFNKLSTIPNKLKIIERQTIINCGFIDEATTVKNFVSKTFLLAWLEYYNNDYLKLIRAVRLDANDNDIIIFLQTTENILTSLFKLRPLQEIISVINLVEQKIPFEELNWETITYWRFLIMYIKKNCSEDILNIILPEPISFYSYIQSYYQLYKDKQLEKYEYLEHNFILEQMFIIVNNYDLSDEASRQGINNLVKDFLVNYKGKSIAINAAILNLEISIPNSTLRTNFICEIISDIMYPLKETENCKTQLEQKEMIKELKLKLNCLLQDKEKAVTDERYLDAKKFTEEIEEINTSISTIQKSIKHDSITDLERTNDVSSIKQCLNVASSLLQFSQVQTLSPSLQILKNELIENFLLHSDVSIRSKALKCYILCCIIDKKTAQIGIHLCSAPILKYHVGVECDVPILLEAIKGITSMLLIYNLDIITTPEENELTYSISEEHRSIFTDGTSLTDIIQGLVDLMNDENEDIQEVAGKCLCKLIFNGAVQSVSLLSHLILKWCNPLTENSLRQYIGVLLENLRNLPGMAYQLQNAVIPIIAALSRATLQSPLAEIDAVNIGKLLLALCESFKEGQLIHYNLAISFLQEIEKDKCVKLNQTLSKMLLMLNLNKKDDIGEILCIYDELRDSYFDKVVKTNLTKFISKMSQMQEEQNVTSSTSE